MLLGSIARVVLLAVAAQPAGEPPSPAPPVVEGTPQIVPLKVLPAAVPTAPDPAAVTMLEALEQVQVPLRALEARIKYDVVKGLAGDRTVRFGKWYYQDERRQTSAGPVGTRKTAARFDTLFMGKVKHDDVQIFIFDGEWLVEKLPGERQMTKRRVAKPGQAIDPLSVEGPLPVPIGQSPAKVLERFDASVADALVDLEPNDPDEKAEYAKFVAGCRQLRLTLREQYQDDSEVRTVRLWYVGGGGGGGAGGGGGKEVGAIEPLPKLIRVENRAGDVTFLQLIEAKRDVTVPPEVMDVTVPPDGWKVDIRE